MGHWYDKEGNLQHFVQGKNGEMRDATLRDARKHHWVPGFSGITSVLSKPGLDKWKENQLLEASMETEFPISDDSMDDSEYFSLWKAKVKKLANERSLKARDRGSEIHDAIESVIKTGSCDGELMKYVEAVGDAVALEFSLDLSALEAETTFSSSLGYGGCGDAIDRQGKGLLIDWKCKSTEFDDKTKLAYPEHVMQLAAYRRGLLIPDAKCANVFIGPDAEIRIHIWTEEELQAGFERFLACLKLWQLDRNYDSSFEENLDGA